MNTHDSGGREREALLKLLEQRLGNSEYNMLIRRVGEDRVLQMLIDSAQQNRAGQTHRQKALRSNIRWLLWTGLWAGAVGLSYFFGIWMLEDSEIWPGAAKVTWEWWYPYAAVPAGLIFVGWVVVMVQYYQGLPVSYVHVFPVIGSAGGLMFLKSHHFGWAISVAVCLLGGSQICLAVATKSRNFFWKSNGVASLLLGIWLLGLGILAWIF